MRYTTISVERDVKEWLEGLKLVERMTYSEVLRCLQRILTENVKDLRGEMARQYLARHPVKTA